MNTGIKDNATGHGSPWKFLLNFSSSSFIVVIRFNLLQILTILVSSFCFYDSLFSVFSSHMTTTIIFSRFLSSWREFSNFMSNVSKLQLSFLSRHITGQRNFVKPFKKLYLVLSLVLSFIGPVKVSILIGYFAAQIKTSQWKVVKNLALTIRLWARDFYRVIVDEGTAQVNYHA